MGRIRGRKGKGKWSTYNIISKKKNPQKEFQLFLALGAI